MTACLPCRPGANDAEVTLKLTKAVVNASVTGLSADQSEYLTAKLPEVFSLVRRASNVQEKAMGKGAMDARARGASDSSGNDRGGHGMRRTGLGSGK